MQKYIAHLRLQAKILLRTPAFLFPTLLFPAMLFSFFGATSSITGAANFTLVSFAIYGVFGVGLFQFGASIAQDRESPFHPWMMGLQGSRLPQLFARITMAIIFSFVSVTVLIIVAHCLADITLSVGQHMALLLVALLITIPSILMGMMIGYLCSARAAVAISNVVYLPLAFLGGLFIPPFMLPSIMQKISLLTPTRHMGEVAWGIALKDSLPMLSVGYLVGFSMVIMLLVFWLMRRDQSRRFG